jgi:hypothetical protein
LAEYVSVIDFGADPTGAAPSTDAFNNALAVASWVYIPPGTYLLDATISLTGDKILSGPESSSNVVQPAKINFTGTGNCFEAVSAEYGGVSIRNLDISGGDGSGAYAIYNTRPQSIFENIHIENWDNSGVALEEAGTGNQASWSTMVRQVKYIAPATATPYRGFQVSINVVKRCAARLVLTSIKAKRLTCGVAQQICSATLQLIRSPLWVEMTSAEFGFQVTHINPQ